MNRLRKILSALIGTVLAVILTFAIVPFVQAQAPGNSKLWQTARP